MNHPEKISYPRGSGTEGGKSDVILVTGASGFLGLHLVRFLSRQGRTLRAVYLKHPPTATFQELKGVTWLQADLLDIYAVEEIIQGVAEVYHCAALVSFHPADREKMMHFNVESTVNIVNEALEAGIRKMVYISSVAALGRSEGNKEITEDEQWEESRHNSRYGLSKHLAEMEVWRGIAEGLNAVIVSPGIILGEGNWDNGSSALLKVAFREFPFYTKGVNAWVDVQDVVRAATQLMDSDVHSERMILSAGNYSYKEVFSMMAEALGKKPPRMKAGRVLSGLVWRWNILRSRLFGRAVVVTKETARNAQKRNFYNNSKLKKNLKDFQYTDIDITIARMAQAFSEELKKKTN